MVEDENLEFTGTPVDVTEALISLSTGWNWIGYTPQGSLGINTALSNIGPDNATYIKSQSGFADYYSGYGWYGQLSDMDPFLGYQIYMVNQDTFTYPEGGGLVRSSDGYKKDNTFSDLSWKVDPHDYEFNGSATIQVALDGEILNSDKYQLIAIDEDGECVGSTRSYKFPLNDSYVFGLMMYNNKEHAQLRFKLYDSEKNRYINLNKTLAFETDMHLGNGLAPVVFNVASTLPEAINVSSAYPNPFNPVVSFDIDLGMERLVSASIFNIKGQKVANIFEGMLNQGLTTLSWNASGFSSGIYFMNVQSNGEIISSQRISLLK